MISMIRSQLLPEFVSNLAKEVDCFYQCEVVDVGGGELIRHGFLFLDEERVLVRSRRHHAVGKAGL